jgi:M6 family metalloprotease-like protein
MKKVLLVLILVVTLVGQPAPVNASGPDTPSAATDLQPSGVVVVSAPSGPDVTTTGNVWNEIPKMKTRIVTPQAGSLAVTFCAEADISGGSLWLEITDNDVTLSPSNVVFAAGAASDSHCFTFVESNSAAGFHVIRALWNAGSSSVTGSMGDRTMTITFSSSTAEELRLLAVAAPSGVPQDAVYAWTDIPNLSGALSLPYNSDLTITFSGEAYGDGGNRLFVRALVDDQVASASDAVVAVGGFIGVRAYTFVQKGVSAGTHTIRLQYSCDGDNLCHVADRTMVVVAAAQGLTRQVVEAFHPATSGPWETTTNTGWENMPDTYQDFTSPSEADLAIQFTASIYIDNPGRLWLRALVDGQVTSPSDVVLESSDWVGNRSHSFTFVVHNLPRGNHSLQMQWGVDGGTGYLSDHTTAAWGFASQHPILMVAMESTRPQGYQFGGTFSSSVADGAVGGVRSFKSYVRDRLFGADPSVARYYLENSYGNYYLVDGGVRGPYLKQYDEKTYRETIPNPFTVMMMEALQKVDQDNFDFSLYDRDGDGIITPKELVTMVAFYQDTTDGFVRTFPNYVTNDGVTLDDSNMPYVYLPDFQTAEETGVMAHELAHVLINAGDMYESTWDSTAPGPYSLMDQHFAHPDLDPWHKLHAGSWFDPHVVNQDGYVVITAVEKYPDIYKLADPNHPGEYFLIENRQKTGYDAGLPDSGLAIWHINENTADVYRNGVMIEPACGPTNPIQWGQYLYDGSGTPWGRDFWWGSTGSNSRWVDGSDSKMGVWAIQASSSSMIVYLDTPGPGVLLQALPGQLTVTPGRSDYIWMRLVNTSSFPDTYQLSTTLPETWVQWSQNPITLTSYQSTVVYLKVTPPKGTPTGPVWFNVTATGTSLPPYPSTTAPTNLLNVTLFTYVPLVKK